MTKLPPSFYQRPDVVQVARDLLGKYLFTDLGVITGGVIVETEAYMGRGDKACHANLGRRTSRTEVMYAEGGRSYVYLCYGIHSLFNVVTNKKGLADAVLIRAIEPTEGISHMLERRGMAKLEPRLTAGPGALSRALGIDRQLYGASLTGNEIWIEDCDLHFEENEIVASPRVGVGYAGEDAQLPWRFRVKSNPYCSPAK